MKQKLFKNGEIIWQKYWYLLNHMGALLSQSLEILGKAGRILEVATIGNLGSSALQDLAGMVLRECMPLKVKILKNIAPKLTLKHSKILFPKEITIMFCWSNLGRQRLFPIGWVV